MENTSTWEHQMLINELTQGMEQAKQLQLYLCATSPSEAQDLLLQRILSSYEKALLILKWNGSNRQAQSAVPAPSAPETSISVDGSPGSEDLNKNFMEHQEHINTSKKRKTTPTWTEQVRAPSENGLEGPPDDGHSWRKYGQKDILGAKYPRSYYRCTYRHVQNCWATKQVQRSDEDPSVFDITYKGTHTCNLSVPSTASPKKQEPINHKAPQHQQNQTLFDLRSKLRVDTEGLDSNEIPPHFSFPSTFEFDNHMFPISEGNSPLLVSPALSGSNYLSTSSTYEMRRFSGANDFQQSEHDVGEIVSAHASTTNSPIGGMEFMIDPVEADPNFPFNIHGFFT